MTPLDMLLSAVGSKSDPNSGGRQMPSHWGLRALNIVSGSSATGMKALHAVGSADASLIFDRVPSIPDRDANHHDDEVIYVSVGDGTTSEGEFWESVNAACARKLPVLFLIEDNGCAISVPVEYRRRAATPKLLRSSPSARGLGANRASLKACAGRGLRARPQGPAAVHARSHVRVALITGRRDVVQTKAEREDEAARDPQADGRIPVTNSIATDADLAATLAEIDAEIEEAAVKALQAPKPARSTATQWVYSPDVDPTSAAFDTPAYPEGKPDTMVGVINRTLRDEMARDPRIVVFGEDIADASRDDVLKAVNGKGGVFKVTHGLQRQFGGDRVFNAPIAEAAIIGRAIGMAIRMKPVVEIQFFDYIWPAMMQIRDDVDDALSLGQPLFVSDGRARADRRLPQGRRPVPQPVGRKHLRALPRHPHRVSLDRRRRRGIAAHSHPVRDPVMFLEHKHLYRQTAARGVSATISCCRSARPAFAARRRRARHHVGSAGPANARGGASGGKGGITTAVLDLRDNRPTTGTRSPHW
jgi:2-oxoisovalerate dehydrogenase E1 component